MCRLVLVSCLVLTAASCSEQGQPAAQMASSNNLKQVGLGLQNFHDTFQTVPFGGEGGQNAEPSPNSAVAPQPAIDRQIIYRATINLQVKNFVDTDREIIARVKEAGGYIAQFNEDRSSGDQRGGRWTVRLPVAGFTGFLDSVGKLGVADRREVQSQDVTEEYVDLEARLKNKQALESRLLELVAKRGDEIKDVIALEQELSRVREEIERLQGKLRFLSDRVSLTTVEISAYERLDYQPEEATLTARIAGTFRMSLDHLRQFGEGLLLVIIALAPWMIVGAIMFLPVAMTIRRLTRSKRVASAVV